MPCAQCGAQNPPGTKFCSNCGATIDAQPAQPQTQGFGGPVSPTAPRPQTAISIDFRRLGIGDIIALAGSVLLFISLFLTWYTIPGGGGSASALGSGAGGWRVLILVLDIIVILYLFVRTMTPRGFTLPLPHWQLLTVVLGLQFLLTLLAFLVKPSSGISGVSVSWGYGAFIGLIVSVIALIGGIMRRSESEVVVPGVPRSGFGSFSSTPAAPQMGITPGGGSQGSICAQCGSAVPTGNPYCPTCGAPASS
jgi:zinc-ribbon domain